MCAKCAKGKFTFADTPDQSFTSCDECSKGELAQSLRPLLPAPGSLLCPVVCVCPRAQVTTLTATAPRRAGRAPLVRTRAWRAATSAPCVRRLSTR